MAEVIDLTKADERNAKLTLKLRSNSGYSCDATYRVSANQWAAILAIVETEPQTTRESPPPNKRGDSNQ